VEMIEHESIEATNTKKQQESYSNQPEDV